MSTDRADDRAALIAGLLDLACFLEAHPDVPVPASYHKQCVNYLPRGTDEEEHAVIDAIAAALGTTAGTPVDPGTYETERAFGPVVYRAFAISSAARAEYTARRSYDAVIRLDAAPAEAA